MIIDTAGDYTLRYTATDECGNSTSVDRSLTVEQPPRTVLYTDGTFIINELARDIDANVAEHGAAMNVYAPFNPNGTTDIDKYIFTSGSQRPWHSQASSVRSVEMDSNIQPISTANWFYNMMYCTNIDLTGLNTSSVTDMSYMFVNCYALTSLDVSNFDTSSVTNMCAMFDNCRVLTSIDVSNFNTSSVTDMSYMFRGCRVLTSIDVSNFNTSSVTNMSYMFRDCRVLTSIDVSNFNTSSVTDMSYMFNNCSALTTIYASVNFAVTQVTNSNSMFASMSASLVGGAGTTWASSNPTDKTYAHIDSGTSDPGYFTAKPSA